MFLLLFNFYGYQIQQVSVSEQFAPLVGVDVTWKNNWSTKFEYTQSRTMAFNFTNFQLQEMFQKSIVFGLGYKTRELTLPFKLKVLYLRQISQYSS